LQLNQNACPVPEPLTGRIAAILFLGVLFFVSFLGRFIFAPLMPTIEKEMGFSHAQAGSIFLMISLGFFLAQLGSGFVTSRVNHRGTLIVSGLGVGLALFAFELTRSIGMVRVVLMTLGLAAGLHMPSALATITAMVRREDWGKALAIHQTAPSLGLVLAPLISEALLRWFSWRTTVGVVGALAIAVAVCYIWRGRGGEFSGETPKPKTVKALLSQPSVWAVIGLFALAIGGGVGTYTMLPLYLVYEGGLDRGRANTLLGLSRISGLFMTFVAGWATDRIGEKRAISVVLLAGGVATILLGMGSDTWLVLFVFVQPAVVACFFPPGFAALSRVVSPSMRSVNSSLAIPLAFLFGAGVVPAGIGFMGQTHTFGLGISLLGVMMLLGPVLAGRLNFQEYDEAGC
jgi:NNP family nitrate/nitrite transporter-like MFS transporter